MLNQDVVAGGHPKPWATVRQAAAGAPVRSRPRRRSRLFTTLAVLTILPAGCNLALPGMAAGPAWAAPYEIVHGVFLHNLATLVWLLIAFAIMTTGPLRAPVPATARRYAAVIALLGLVGLVSTLVNGARFSTWADFGECARIFLLAFSVLLISYWARTMGPGFIMRWYLTGLVIGGLVNIYFSITNPYNSIGSVPFLYSRNGGGGILALGITLGAWMWHRRDVLSRLDRVVVIAASLVGLAAAAMSFSRTSMLIGASGILTWLLVLNVSPLKVLRTKSGIALLTVMTILMVLIPGEKVSAILAGVRESVRIKFTAALSPEENSSVNNRLAYYVAAAEIVRDNPIIGVGYSGFLPSVLKTNPYKTNQIDEDPDSGKASNPHNSFLQYLIANGVIGLAVITMLYVIFVRAVYRSIRGSRLFALAVTAAIAAVYLLYANALPTLFKTEVMYLPAAVAMTLQVRSRPAS